MKRNRLIYGAQMTIVCVLATVGLIALCGEPTEDANFILTVFIQLVVAAVCLTAASFLAYYWDLNKKTMDEYNPF